MASNPGLSGLSEHGFDAVTLIAPDGTIIYTSPSTTNVLGYWPDEIVGCNVFTLIHTDDHRYAADLFSEILCARATASIAQFRLRHKDGTWRWLQSVVTNGLSSANVNAVVANYRDITQLKSEVHRLDLVEGQFRVLIENAVHITAILDPDRTIRYISPVVQRMLGYAPEMLKGMDVLDFVHPDDVAVVTERLDYRIQHPGVGELVEFRARHRDGSWRVLEAIATNRIDDPLTCEIVVDARDITERKWSAERLQRSLDAILAIHDVGRRLGSSLEQHAIGAALLEAATCVAPIDAGAIFLRNTRGRLRLVQSAGPKELWEAARKARSARTPRQQVLLCASARSFRFTRRNDGMTRIRAWALPLRVQDRVVGILEVYGPGLADGVEDETLGILADQAAGALERARLYGDLAEREQRLETLVGRLFIAQDEHRRHVAHDIHDGLAQLAAAAHEHLEVFSSRYHSRSRLQRDDLAAALDLMTRTVREARRVISGLRPTALDEFGLAMAISLEVQALRAEGWQIEYTEALGAERLPVLIETALFRVVQEALTNVRKHAHSRRVAVTLTRRGPTAYLEVRDWGRGFRPTAVACPTGSSEHVGLAGVQERIGLLGGRCAIRSRLGMGTRVIVEVPLAPAKRQCRRCAHEPVRC